MLLCLGRRSDTLLYQKSASNRARLDSVKSFFIDFFSRKIQEPAPSGQDVVRRTDTVGMVV